MADDPVDAFLSQETQLESRRRELIKEILREKEAANKVFDDRLARLGHHDNQGAKRTHHRKNTEEAKKE
jgi:hypothetical protein